MSFINKVFGKKTPNSAAIAAEIEKARKEHDDAIAKRDAAMAGLSVMDDSTHQTAEVEREAYRRAADRAAARIVELEKAHGEAVAVEEAAQKTEADKALKDRAEACQRANTVEAKKLLASYAEHAEAIADIIARLKAIDAERDEVNTALRSNPVADPVTSYTDIHRKHPDQQASEQRALAPHWVYRDAPPQPGELHSGNVEKAVRATLDEHGEPTSPGGAERGRFGQIITPHLEHREIVVSRTRFRPGRTEDSLDAVRLPPAFAGGKWAWPRS